MVGEFFVLYMKKKKNENPLFKNVPTAHGMVVIFLILFVVVGFLLSITSGDSSVASIFGSFN